jgi:hypothetical protein
MNSTRSLSQKSQLLTRVIAWMGEKIILDLSLFKRIEAAKKAKKGAAAQEMK